MHLSAPRVRDDFECAFLYLITVISQAEQPRDDEEKEEVVVVLVLVLVQCLL